MKSCTRYHATVKKTGSRVEECYRIRKPPNDCISVRALHFINAILVRDPHFTLYLVFHREFIVYFVRDSGKLWSSDQSLLQRTQNTESCKSVLQKY